MAKSKDRYAKVLRRMWADTVFLAWSRPQPNAQSLWQYLLTTPVAGSIPGVYVLSLADAADRLGWPLEDTKRVFGEILASSRAVYDEPTRLLYLPAAIRIDSPQSPNVVTSWRRQWQEIPESALKERIASDFAVELTEVGATFISAWETFGRKPSRKKVESLPESFAKGFQDSSRKKVESLPERKSKDSLYPVSVLVDSSSGGAGGGEPADALQRRLTDGGRVVLAELQKAADLWPVDQVPAVEVANVAQRIADEVSEPTNRAKGEEAPVAREAVREARAFRAKFKHASAAELLARAEQKAGWEMRDYRSGKKARAGAPPAPARGSFNQPVNLDLAYEVAEMEKTIRGVRPANTGEASLGDILRDEVGT